MQGLTASLPFVISALVVQMPCWAFSGVTPLVMGIRDAYRAFTCYMRIHPHSGVFCPFGSSKTYRDEDDKGEDDWQRRRSIL